jgi:hypothetical protein
MSGNAMEWTATPVEGSHLLEPEYVIKGGCWSFSIEEAQSWKRHTDPPGDLWNALGFRGCVQSASAEDKAAAEERARIRELGDLFAAFVAVSPFDAIAKEISGLPASKSRQIAFDFVDYIDAQLLGRLRNRQAVAVLDGLARIVGVVADRLGDSECAVRATYAKALILLAEHNGAGSIELLEGCVNHYRQTGAEKELATALVALAEAESSRNLTFGRERLDAKSAQAHVEEGTPPVC